ncbi:hypothetical protein [Paludisphaera rhizosphaerae]|uniref:hypothetical protein n=1 Tax=Paludisphaera rhizosphaerae TaxID=2711216 RepID=UPI0013EE2317|nr:hypothetical protein [Paludisphaera rhizosphaerae]
MDTIIPLGSAGADLRPTSDAAAPPRSPRLASYLFAAGAAAAVIAGIAGEALHGTFAAPRELIETVDLGIGARLSYEQAVARIKNATLASAVLGGVLGLTMGAAGGAAARSRRRAMVAGSVGLILGAAVGGQAAWALTPFADANRVRASDDLGYAILMHGAVWGAVGATAGLAFALGRGGGWKLMLRAALGGLIGALGGTVAYDLIGAAAFPMAETWSVLAQSPAARSIAYPCVAICASLGIAASLGVVARRPEMQGHIASAS